MYNPHDIVSVGKGMFCLTGTYTLQNEDHIVILITLSMCVFFFKFMSIYLHFEASL